jgi:hypothetical protein
VEEGRRTVEHRRTTKNTWDTMITRFIVSGPQLTADYIIYANIQGVPKVLAGVWGVI